MNYQIVICLLFTFQITIQGDLLSTRKELNDQILYSCNFENDTCQMSVEAAPSGFTWTRFSGSTPSETTGPDFDHTTVTANGYYMYTEATSFEPGEIAKLRLPSLAREPQGAICLTFWYHMYGMHIGALNVSQNDSILWSLRFNQSYEWIQKNVTIRTPSAGSIRFVGVRGGFDIGQPYGDIAIDDVIIYDEPCEYETTTEEPTTTTTELITTVITTTEAITSTNKIPLHTSTSTNETAATTAVRSTTQTVANVTQPETTTLAVTSLQINQTNDFKTEVTNSSVGLSQGVSTTVGAMAMSTASNDSTTESQLNSTGNNATTAAQSSGTFSTDNNFTTTAADSNNVTYNVSKSISPAAIAEANSTTSTMKTDSVSYNNTEMNATDSNYTSAPKYEYLPSTPGMLSPDSQASSSKKIWNLSEQNLILLLAFLGAFILILILAVAVLACCLCVTRRRYNVARSANVYNSNSTLDRSSLSENQRAKTRTTDLY
jgi:hypothetical protein